MFIYKYIPIFGLVIFWNANIYIVEYPYYIHGMNILWRWEKMIETIYSLKFNAEQTFVIERALELFIKSKESSGLKGFPTHQIAQEVLKYIENETEE